MIVIARNTLTDPVLVDLDPYKFLTDIDCGAWDTGGYFELVHVLAEYVVTTSHTEASLLAELPQHEWQLIMVYNEARSTWRLETYTQGTLGYVHEVYLTECAECDVLRAVYLVIEVLG